MNGMLSLMSMRVVKQRVGKTTVDGPWLISLDYTVLQEYNISQKHATFGHQDQLNYAVHVYDEGKVLSIVTVAGSHGTHVAGIVSANYADTPDLNGCAPGAQIVSLKIGDTRLGSMETGQAFTRAVIEIVRHKVDIINISYGEDASLPDKGRIIELLRDVLTRDHGVVVVSSAGNAGPALTTSGSPGATSSNVIGVGAWVSSAMMQAAYSLLNPVDENIFTWSSRGPTADGARGMSVYAPGGAITSVANYELEKSRLMNGTSMSSPNACGGISLVLSALKAQNLPYTPYGIRKAVEYTGMDIKGSEGPGLLQVDKAYEYLISYKDVTDLGIAFEVKVPHNGKQQRGIYLRDPIETSKIQRYKANVTPKFKEEQTTEAVALDLKLALVSTASWVRVPAALAMTGGGRAFDVQVDPTSLPVGDHYADVHAYDVATPNRVVFTVPITVTKPITVPADTNTISFKDQKFIPGQIQRRFVAVPDGATMAELRLRSQGHSSPIMSFTHLVQLHPQTRHVDSQEQYVLTIVENEPTAKTFKVRGGVTLEVCISQFWSSLGDMNLDIEVEFFGLDVVGGKPIAIAGGEGLQKVEFASRLRNEDLEPSISLDNLRKFIRPTESKMNSLTDRDRLPDGRVIFERVLTYNIKQVTDSNPTVKFSWPFAHHVYESALDSNLWFLFDAATKERIQFGDAVPRPEKLAKGDYILRLQLRHDDVEILERLKNLPVIMDIKLGKSASLDISSDHIEAFRKKNPSFSKVRLSAGSRIAIQVNTNIESLPKDAKLGDLLTGQMSCGKGRAPKFPVTYIIAPEPIIKGDGDEAPAAKAEVTMLDMQVGALKKLTKDEEKETLLKTLIKEHPDHLAVRVAQLDALTEGSEKTKPADVVEAADAIIKLVDAQELAVFFAQKHPSQIPLTDADKKKRKEMTEKKSALVEALRRKLLVETGDEKTFNLYSQYIDDFSKDGKALMVYAKREITQGRHGNALKCIVKYLGDVQRGDSGVQATAKKVRDLRTECLKALGWKLWVDYYTSWALVHEPGSYALF